MQDIEITLSCRINHYDFKKSVPVNISALTLLRDHLQLKGVKEGCGIGECGACTILVNGRAMNSCLMLAVQLEGCEVFTVEGLSNKLHFKELQKALLNRHAVQCGFCTPGMLISAFSLLQENPHLTRQEIVKGISGNLCRCTGYEQIIDAIQDMVHSPGKEET